MEENTGEGRWEEIRTEERIEEWRRKKTRQEENFRQF